MGSLSEEANKIYLAECKKSADFGCYHQLRTDKDLIKKKVLDSLGRNGNGYKRSSEEIEEISRVLETSEAVVLGFFERKKEEFPEGFFEGIEGRFFGWPNEYHERLRLESLRRLSTARQPA
ncbi:MAG: hypothetical protein Q7S06_04040 [Nanoarchaeota archaeon]|nr:hypothetical protein [Nanoarchaeota archaeon]